MIVVGGGWKEEENDGWRDSVVWRDIGGGWDMIGWKDSGGWRN